MPIAPTAHTAAPSGTSTLPPGLWLARHAQPVVTLLPTSAASPARSAVRHACPAPVRPASAYCYGQTDWPADPLPTQHAAHALALALATTHPPPADGDTETQPQVTVRCSPLKRCRQLAEALAALRPEVTVVHDHRLAELHFGDWEGLPWDDVPRAEVDAWAAQFGTYRMGTRGETVHELVQRVAELAHPVRQAHGVHTSRPERPANESHPALHSQVSADRAARALPPDALWITHAGVIRAMHWLQARQWPSHPPLPQGDDWPTHVPAFGGWCHLPWVPGLA